MKVPPNYIRLYWCLLLILECVLAFVVAFRCFEAYKLLLPLLDGLFLEELSISLN
jgi:hypothetical protein